MVKMLTNPELMAIENMGIIMGAKKQGLPVFPEDLLVNYAHISEKLNSLENSWSKKTNTILRKTFLKWLQGVSQESDLKKKIGLAKVLQPLLMEFIKDVWDYGQQTADQEIKQMELMAFGEEKSSLSDLTNNDAFEWYELYMLEIAKQQEAALFHYMMPLILEYIGAGLVETKLAAALATDFARYGSVRAGIIARTESNKAFNWGRRYRFDPSPAIKGYRYSAILDERTTDICNFLHGHSWAIDDPNLNEHTPPNHYQCRGLLVPISKYVSYEMNPPAAGWEDQLPPKEKKVFDKFKDSTFYPNADAVKDKAKPKMAKPKAQKKASK